MACSLLTSLIVFGLFSLSSSLPVQTILDAAEVLSDSGYLSMSLTLELVSQTLLANSPSATVFAPSNAAFIESGQPPLSLLQFHSSPLALSFESLRSLPVGAKIPTLLGNHSLILTSTDFDSQISLNNVNITASPLFDDASLIIFGVDKFFDPNFPALSPTRGSSPSPSPNAVCTDDAITTGGDSFVEASGVLRSRGYSLMASFLDLQLLGLRDDTQMTVLAPVDEAMMGHVGNFSDISPSIFLRHVLPCKVSWSDLVNLDNGSRLWTSLEGFAVEITQSGDALKLNQVALAFPEVYYSDWLVVHGLGEVLSLTEEPEQAAEPWYGTGGSNNDEQTALGGNNEF